jgi:hypothetical protein
MTTTETRFYVELPADEYGNTAWPVAVIEARILPPGSPEAGPLANPDRPKMLIAGPAEIVSRWPSCYADRYDGFAEVEGPARMLSREEYDALIETVRTIEPTGDPR